MHFAPTSLHGVMLIELEPKSDERGSFTRTFCDDEFARAGILAQPSQISLSRNTHAFTLRGLHYQAEPFGECKIVQCIRGRIHDVVLDLRPTSASYRNWLAIELAADQPRMIYIPKGCAHGFLTLEESSDVLYLIGQPFISEAGRGVRWNDPAFGIDWPAEPRIILPRDASYPDFER